MCHKLHTFYTFYTVDRIEDGIAVLYDDYDNKSDVPITEFPEDIKNIKEGDRLGFDAENNIYTIYRAQTAQIKLDLEKRFNKLFKN